MFWYSQSFWYGLAIILVLTFISLAVAIYLRKKRLENRFTVVIENGGNVPSQYLLRLDNPNRSFECQFSQNGRRLAVEVLPGLPGTSPSAPKSSTGLQGLAGQAQSAGFTVTEYAPSEVSAPILGLNEDIAEGQRGLGTIQYYLRKLGISGNSSQSSSSPANEPQDLGDEWAVTDEIQAGNSLKIELMVVKKRAPGMQQWAFQVVSRSKRDDKAPAVIQEGTGMVRGTFWASPVWPVVMIVGIAVLLVIGIAVLTSVSLL